MPAAAAKKQPKAASMTQKIKPNMMRPRAQHEETAHGKTLCAFVSLTVVSKIEAETGAFMKKRGLGKKTAIEELEKIRAAAFSGNKWPMAPLT